MSRIKVRPVAKVTNECVDTLKYLQSKAKSAATVFGFTGEDFVLANKLNGDVTKYAQLRQAFPQEQIDTLMTKVAGDKTTVGTIGDLTILAKQSDIQARCIRACNLQYATRADRKLQAAFRLRQHGGDNGLWQDKIDKLQSLVQQNSAANPNE